MHAQSNAQPAYKASDDLPASYPGPRDVFPILLPRRQQRAILFALGMKRHGQPAYWMRSQSHGRVLAWLENKVRDEERFDLGDKELLGIAKRITQYAVNNLLSGRTQAGFKASQTLKGQRSGKARRAATAERDADIEAMVKAGGTISAAARKFGEERSGVWYPLARSTVRNILQRDRFKGGDEPKSQAIAEPNFYPGDEPKPFKRNKTWYTGDNISEQERRGRMRAGGEVEGEMMRAGEGATGEVEALEVVSTLPDVERTPLAAGQMMMPFASSPSRCGQ